MYPAITVRCCLAHSEMMAWDGYFSSADSRASLQWSLMFLVLMPRQHMLGDCMIISGLHQVGPNSSPSESLRPRALHRYRRVSPFLAVGLLQYPRWLALLQDGHRAPVISPTAASRAAAKPSSPEIMRISRMCLRSLPVDTRNPLQAQNTLLPPAVVAYSPLPSSDSARRRHSLFSSGLNFFLPA